MEPKRPKTSVYKFGPFVLSVNEHRLLRDGEEIHLPPKAFALLVLLVENSGSLLTKETMLQSIWQGVTVEEGNVAYNISLLRRALGDTTRSPRFVETVSRIGYRFTAQVQKSNQPDLAGTYLSVGHFFLRTKMLLPRPVEDLVLRPRLTEKLLANMSKGATFIAANAGSGKTTLIADFIRKQNLNYVWYQLDHIDADPLVFLGYVIFGIQRIIPGFGEALLLQLKKVNGSSSQKLGRFLDRLLKEIVERVNHQLILVLDDYQRLNRDSRVHTVLAQLLAKAPKVLHVMAISREQPPNLPIHGEARLSIIDSSDLLFNNEETRQLFSKRLNLDITNGQLAEVREQVNGWITGLKLICEVAHRSRMEQDDNGKQRDAIELLSRAETSIFEYFAKEVFATEDTVTQELLLRASLLDDIDLDICQGLFDAIASNEIFSDLVRKNQFISLTNDVDVDVYRFHPLFQRFLQSRLRHAFGPDRVRLQHVRYAEVFLQRRDWEQAIRHFLAADEFERAGAVLSEQKLEGMSDLAETLIAQTDAVELRAREVLANFGYQQARSLLSSASRLDPKRAERLAAEFGFVVDPNIAKDSLTGSDDLNKRWLTQVWRILSKHNQTTPTFLRGHDLPTEPAPEIISVEPERNETKARSQAAQTSERRGELLERAVLRLFEEFFRLGEQSLDKLRQQRRGTQFGHDISFESVLAWDQTIRCHVECKNLSKDVTLKDIADKLISQLHFDKNIDIWILISPLTNPSNELDQILEAWKSDPQYPFDVQVWCPATGVQEFFGLQPLYYDEFFYEQDNDAHPRHWNETKRSAVREKWRQKLQPPVRLPRGWANYLRQPQFQCLHRENSAAMESTFANHVSMQCRTDAGALMPQPLENYVRDWLARGNPPVFFLLGEFGDGKSFFTYALTRKLAAEFLRGPKTGVVPLRLSLRDFWSAGTAREFLRQRLEDYGADLEGWTWLKANHRLLVILDGFDEMSKELDPMSITRNIQALLECFEEFEGCKVMITSRTHFFERRHDVARLMTRLRNPVLYYLSPISRQTTEQHLQLIAAQRGLGQALAKLRGLHDPIGLAAKPFFLQMLKDTLNNLPEDLNELTLYDQYVRNSLMRKAEQLDDPNLMIDREELIDNLVMILEAIAFELQVSQEEYVSLSRFATAGNKSFAELLWRMTGSDSEKQDAQARVGIRSLLSRVRTPKMDEEWTVDFCHRSIREYFVARGVCAALADNLEKGLQVFKGVTFNHEILEFASTSLRKTDPVRARNNLLQLIQYATPENQPGRLGGTALTLLYRLSGQFPGGDWTGKVFDFADLEGADLSGMSFRDSSFRFADLTNVNFENANFQNCDLTGVRIEETAPVASLTSRPSQERVVAIYGDGAAREWNIEHPRKNESRLLGSDLPFSGAVFGIRTSGDAWLCAAGEFRFLHLTEGASIRDVARFPMKSSYRFAIPNDIHMLIVEDSGDGMNTVLLIDLSTQGVAGSVRAPDVTLCAALEPDCFVVNNSHGGLQMLRPNSETEISAMSLTDNVATCLATLCVEKRLHLLAYGRSDGSVEIIRIDLRQSLVNLTMLAGKKLHTGPITSVSFLGDSRVVSGGLDRTIVVSRFDSEDVDHVEESGRTLQLTVRCKGMRINGLKGPAEHASLGKLIKKAEVDM